MLGIANILVIQLINVVRKTKKIKTKSKKIKTKKYRISFLFGNCRMIDSTSIGEPEVFDGGKINIPITLTYSDYEKR